MSNIREVARRAGGVPGHGIEGAEQRQTYKIPPRRASAYEAVAELNYKAPVSAERHDAAQRKHGRAAPRGCLLALTKGK